jgi:hypothetical protein
VAWWLKKFCHNPANGGAKTLRSTKTYTIYH